jgi:tRNA(Ile)-lysidine synthase
MPVPDLIRGPLNQPHAGPSGLVVAVSGGADSVALLRAIVSLRSEQQYGPLVIAHLNHGLRGEESNGDEQFVSDLGAKLSATDPDIHVAVRRVDVARLARQERANVEAVARYQRYRFFVDVATQFGAGRIATAHTANDQAETVLLRMVRGTGLQGLRGIARRRILRQDLTLIRPLLDATRLDVMTFLGSIGQSFREDHSNKDTRFTRNRVRHDLLPRLAAGYNPAIVPVLCRLADQAAELFLDMRRQAVELLLASERPAAGPLRILDTATLAGASRNLCREALRQLWQREGWPRDRMRRSDWDRVASIAFGEASVIDLPGQLRARRRGRVLQVGPRDAMG